LYVRLFYELARPSNAEDTPVYPRLPSRFNDEDASFPPLPPLPARESVAVSEYDESVYESRIDDDGDEYDESVYESRNDDDAEGSEEYDEEEYDDEYDEESGEEQEAVTEKLKG
jgi:hypothetical protein